MGQRTVICLTSEEEQTLRQWARAGTSEHRMVERAKVTLLAHQGKSNLEIAEHLKTRPARVSKWRQRFGARRLDGLRDADRKGRPAHYDKASEKRVLTMLDEPPPEGYGKWSGSLLAEALGDISDDQVWRVLRKHDICLQLTGSSKPTTRRPRHLNGPRPWSIRTPQNFIATFIGASGYLVAAGARSRPPQWK